MPNAKLTAADLYAKGVFTTLAIVRGDAFLWDKHWDRLSANAQELDIDISSYRKEFVLDELIESIGKSGLQSGRARITLYDQSPSQIWSTDAKKKTSLSIIVAERRPVPANFKLTISPHRVNTTSPLAGVKSCNYLEHLLAYEEASKCGFHEAIRLNERGEIASACMANVFWENGGRLFTPSLATGCLPGTTREYLMENVECEEVWFGVEVIESADRIFLTSAGIGTVPVAEFNKKNLDTSDHPLQHLLPF